jgi:hypothetical protein
MVTKFPSELTDRFHPSLVKKNQSNQDYVAIDGYINRLNDVLGTTWNWAVNSWEFRDGPPTAKGKPQYIAIVNGTLSVTMDDVTTSRDGSGAGFNFDPDTSVKTAQAEALKKACHQFGIALYLWSEDERNFVQKQRDAMTDDVALKKLVMEYTIRELGLDPNEQPSREDIVKCLGVDDLSIEHMRAVMAARGVI